ncbi:MAG TPA: efflux RND transporter periplasmic adaptor subunit, partial [Crenalkalicoccus sp.]|nr:efflux RND transporter periplasmic adaptor subunit [Crenalkalicoccus sp.]
DARGAMVAPFAGAILAIGATPGELVDTNREFFTLADLSFLWVYADVPARELGAVRPGARATLTVDAYPGRRFEGRVAYVADQLDPRTGTARVRCEVPNPDGALRINMFGTVAIEERLGRDGILVPDAAIQLVDGEPTVFLRTGPERFERRVVRTGLREDGQVEVTQGLEGGEKAVTQGSFQLKSALLHSRVDVRD